MTAFFPRAEKPSEDITRRLFLMNMKGLRCKQSDIVAIICHRGVVETSGKFTAGVFDNDDNFAIGVINAGGKYSDYEGICHRKDGTLT
jgi:hypothetical protein